ncbi:hypothetical protein BMF94_2861 [Rhodotorula taiwanensis]|uniref:CENP-V/GFA domain-containing protein n=1 Tax=Rhodotorula taiwanensis TaxID=741276 RepID=A0A2S5BB94_9BASI|nr:hypothetical protein BMF94_2861 [Rhodotorula taiwanensis]
MSASHAEDKSYNPDAPSFAKADHSKPYYPCNGLATDGFSNENEATATCFCGAVQYAFPVKKPGLVDTFVCHCYDCNKLTASVMGTAAFVVKGDHLRNIRGEDNLTSFGQSDTTTTKNKMTTSFCKTCGTVMYRVGSGFPGLFLMRIGTVDDLSLAEGVLKPRIEQFNKDRMSYLTPAAGVEQYHGYYYGAYKQ